MRLHLGHPDSESTLQLLDESAIRDRSAVIDPILDPATLARINSIANLIYVDRSILEYVNGIIEATRDLEGVRTGVSVRGALSYVRAAKAWAAAQGRNHVLPSDIQDLAHPILEHRLSVEPEARMGGTTDTFLVDQVMKSVPEPAG